MSFENKNDKQSTFNIIRGILVEKSCTPDSLFCSFVLSVGYDKPRLVHLTCKKDFFEKHAEILNVGEKIVAQFYITSKKKGDKWYTFANLLGIEKHNPNQVFSDL
jgi:hypothetical protein